MKVKKSPRSCSSSSGDSRISVDKIHAIIERLKYSQNRESTAKNYLTVWRQFNNFVIKLDKKPPSWEEKTTLFIAYLIDNGAQSQTVKSYVSAIKATLTNDGYVWDEKKVLISVLTRACKMVNDRVVTRLPIQCGLLELVLFELERKFLKTNQIYLLVLYQAIFALAYYGMFRAGELTVSQHIHHTMRACNVHMGVNKEKLLVVLYTSKTHDRSQVPQKIEITSNKSEKSGYYQKRNFCPFTLVNRFIEIRGDFNTDDEPFFVFSDGAPVYATQVRKILKEALKSLGLNERLYNLHSMRAGRSTDLAKFNFSISEIKSLGRWKSSCVYRYIKP